MPIATGFVHEAVLYSGVDALVERVVPFLRDAVEADEPAMVVLPTAKLDAVRDALGASPDDRLIFGDMGALGGNPSRIIPTWRWFVDAHAGSAVRGVGEPIGPQHRGPELVERHRHETLLNVAFAGEQALQLLCPYDVDALDDAVIDDVRRSHPVVDRSPCSGFVAVDPDEPFAAPLAAPVPPVAELAFGGRPLSDVRAFVGAAARAIGLGDEQVNALVLCVNEAATNSVLHGGGGGRVRVWHEQPFVVAEVSDEGWIRDPLVGRRWPAGDVEAGRGLWLANQLCDLVQVHSTRTGGSAVRLHVRI